MTFVVGACAMWIGLTIVEPAYAQSASPQAATPAQEENHEAHHPEGDQAVPVPAPQTPPAAMQQKMMEEMKAMHGRLDALVAKMNAATGDAKVAAMAELLTAMVGQQTMMREGMMKMHGGMTMPMKDMK
jgi:hypothetical protein